jgi:hypothetical protein
VPLHAPLAGGGLVLYEYSFVSPATGEKCRGSSEKARVLVALAVRARGERHGRLDPCFPAVRDVLARAEET